ncbi:lytic transglycosylase domain-containing protein [Actinoplanes sp. NPDC051494]|uniref:aggregation-promoting factor C-terminal-like domain-containing protein n=1 Tax=Actinoplanes sp. NPDC051494 TaxID=3363907 RepID=UPI0037899FFD
MNRLLSRVGIRSASVGLLVLGTIGGVYLGQGREVQAQQQDALPQLVVQSNTIDEMQLLKERHSQHASTRAYQRQAEGDAASKVATEARAAAAKAHTVEAKAIEKAEAEKKEAEEKEAAEQAAAASESDSGGSTTPDVDVPASCDEFSGNRATGCALTLSAGFGLSEFSCLNKLWKKESGWNEKAVNTGSGAYGIPQALPGSKMASVASDWKTNAATQIKWGIGYIEGRYNTPCGAWSHSQSVGWY